MKPANKQMALKGALLVVLAANLSWHGAKQMNSSNMASLAGELGAQGPAPAHLDTAPPSLRVAGAVSADAPGAKPDAAVGSQTAPTLESTEMKMICSVPIKIHYVQTKEAGKDVVHTYVTNRQTLKDILDRPEDGTYNDLVANASSKAQLDQIVHDSVVESLTAQGKDCSSDVAQSQAPAPQSPTAPQDTRADEIARGQRNCTLDKDGHPLKNSEKYECNLAKLQAISLDTSSDDDADSDPRSSRPRSRHGRRENSGITAVMNLLTPLENSVRGLLISSNDDKRDEGESRLDDLIQTLSDIKDTATNPSDERTMSRLIDTLQKGYVLGEKVARTAAERSNQMQSIDDRLSDLKLSQASATNMYQAQALNQQVQMLSMQRQMLQQSLSSNTDFLRLRAMNQQGLIDSNSFTDFTADYSSLLSGVYGAGGLGMNGLATAPDGLAGIRSGMQTTDPRFSGLTNMAYPNINYAQLGLQNPSIIGGQNPMFPTSTVGYPQVSGYPVANGIPSTTPYPSTVFPQTNLPSVLPANTVFNNTQQAGQFPMTTFPQSTFQTSQFPMTTAYPYTSTYGLNPQVPQSTVFATTQPMRL